MEIVRFEPQNHYYKMLLSKQVKAQFDDYSHALCENKLFNIAEKRNV